MSPVQNLVDDLQRPWRHGEHVDACDMILETPLVLDGLDVRGFDLSRAVLKAGLSARGTRFRGLAWLRDAQIQGDCDLTGARFRTDLRADGLIAGRVVLDHCRLEGVLSLARARLETLSLRKALVMANVTMQDAAISNLVDLSDAEIMGGLWTADARLGALTSASADISGRVRLPDNGQG